MSWGFADIYGMDEVDTAGKTTLEDVRGDDWRNILVWGRATATGVYPETLALIGRARSLADDLGCRVEVLLIGEELDAAIEVLKRYPVDTVYKVPVSAYQPIDATAKILEAAVRKRRPELVLVFQSRTGDAVTAYTSHRLGVGYVLGATQVDIDTSKRRAVVTHQAVNESFHIVTEMHDQPQFVSVQRGLYRAPMEDPYSSTQVHGLDIDVASVARIEVLDQRPPEEPGLGHASRVVVAGSRVHTAEQVELAKQLAKHLGASFGVAQSVVERGLADASLEVGRFGTKIQPRLLVTVGVQGSLDFLEAIEGKPTIAALACAADDPITRHAAYRIPGTVEEAVRSVLEA